MCGCVECVRACVRCCPAGLCAEQRAAGLAGWLAGWPGGLAACERPTNATPAPEHRPAAPASVNNNTSAMAMAVAIAVARSHPRRPSAERSTASGRAQLSRRRVPPGEGGRRAPAPAAPAAAPLPGQPRGEENCEGGAREKSQRGSRRTEKAQQTATRGRQSAVPEARKQTPNAKEDTINRHRRMGDVGSDEGWRRWGEGGVEEQKGRADDEHPGPFKKLSSRPIRKVMWRPIGNEASAEPGERRERWRLRPALGLPWEARGSPG